MNLSDFMIAACFLLHLHAKMACTTATALLRQIE
jgi:hypothetical protein